MDNRTPLTAASKRLLNEWQDLAGAKPGPYLTDMVRAIEAEALDREREAVAGLREAILFFLTFDTRATIKARAILHDALAATEAATRDASPEPRGLGAPAISELMHAGRPDESEDFQTGYHAALLDLLARLAAPTTPRPR